MQPPDEQYLHNRVKEALQYIELDDKDSVAMVLRDMDRVMEIAKTSHHYDLGWDITP